MPNKDVLSTSVGVSSAISKITLTSIIIASVVLVTCLIATKFILKIITSVLDKSPMNLSMASFIRSAMKLILIFLTIILTADILGIPITSFIALLGVFGLAVSLSIQGAFSNMANGVMILITRPFDVGDFIEMPNESGRVVMLNLVHTQLETADKKIIFIPNSMVASSTITNHSLNKTRRSEVKVTASREIPMETVRSVLFEAVASMPVILTDPAPQVLISSFNKYLVHYLVRFWVEAEDVASSTYQLTEVIYEYYEKYNII